MQTATAGRLDRGPNIRKLRDMILRICELSRKDDHFGAIKLNKLLFYADFRAYLKLGQAISNQPYIKYEFGPVPKDMDKILARMERAKEVARAEETVLGGYKQRRTFALKKPSVKRLKTEEIAIIDEVVVEFCNHGAMQISESSHGYEGWALANLREEIPYYTALTCKPVLTASEVAHAVSLGPKARKLLAVA